GGGDGEPLWDIRLPNARAQLEALLYSGVTSVLSPAHDADTETLAAQLAAGAIPGPFLYRSTRMITARGGHPVPLYWEVVPAPWPVKGLLIGTAVREVTTPDEAKAAVAGDVAAFAPEFVKVVYDSFPPGSPHLSREVLAAAVAEARRLGRRVLVHVGTASDAVEAAEAGASMLAHVPRQHRFTLEEARRIAATGIPFVPTVGVFLDLDRQFNQRRDFTALEREVMKPSMETSFASRPEQFPIKGFPANFAQLLPEIDRVSAENVLKLREAGAPMLVGSDAGLPGVFHGPGMHEEMKKLVELGIPAAEVLRAATSVAAKWLDPAERFGVVAEGARADLLLVDGDPLADISATQRIAGVWKGGRPVRRIAPPARR
ncbi:MAG: amidohydrolase family protein, partial [Myxococcaceae bacterium]